MTLKIPKGELYIVAQDLGESFYVLGRFRGGGIRTMPQDEAFSEAKRVNEMDNSRRFGSEHQWQVYKTSFELVQPPSSEKK